MMLLFAADEDCGLGMDDETFNYTHSSAYSTQIKPPKMLCFGNYDHSHGDGLEIGFSETAKKSGVTCSDSSSKRRNGLGQESVQSASTISLTTTASQRTSKKTKSENPTSTGNAKRKEKLGERIAALQQLVSPFGKTDTASVLHEAMGYIRFLHDQVQVLCSPYLQRLPSLPDGEMEEARKDLRSRGLCLAPVEYTMHVANNNGADFWSPAMANNNNNVSSIKY
ncbi:basic helix-loop-helix DNA-binding superfamily protein [Prunus dulcis]|uniref:Basic helix-loop-helix DNA-binding superfamily protein n=1 Tax=Prunus dulcis TaxID=3755 RepID=A0A4Y1S057_PRUDU|nr:basic helix-loop-helix DNA-binding superfamily protein [Prunus dulcis]